MRGALLALVGLAASGLGSAGCLQKMLVDGQIESARGASEAVDTIGDYELGRTATQAALAQFEGLHRLAPQNADALLLLVKGWTAYASGFVQDELETAQDAGDEAAVEYQKQRARMAYDRAVFYGLQALAQKAEGFDEARKTEPALTGWLADHFDAPNAAAVLFWTGYAWVSRVDLMKGDALEGPAQLADHFVGAALLGRSVALDPGFDHFAGLAALGAYHARSNVAELSQAKDLLEAALAKTDGRALFVPVVYATRYACVRGDGVLYQDLLNRVLAAQDPDPYQRLANAVAKRRAKRWLSRRRAKEQCGIDLAAPSAPK